MSTIMKDLLCKIHFNTFINIKYILCVIIKGIFDIMLDVDYIIKSLDDYVVIKLNDVYPEYEINLVSESQ